MKIKKVLTVFFLFSLVLSSCDKKNAFLVNRRRKYVDPDKANPVGAMDECRLCRKNVSKDFSTCKACRCRFCTKCLENYHDVLPDEKRLCPACNTENSIFKAEDGCGVCFENLNDIGRNFSACVKCTAKFCTKCVEEWYKNNPRRTCPAYREEDYIFPVLSIHDD